MVVPKIEVLVTVGGAVRARYECAPGDYELGSDPACAIHLDAEGVAARHARLTVNYNEWLIADLGSAQATLLDGESIAGPARVFPSQRIALGAATLELRRMPDAAAPPLPPSQQQRYAIGKMVARGGMGAILDARDSAIARHVAMKVMLQRGSEHHAARFVQEAKITGQLEHPNIVPVHELSVDEHGRPFYTMKMVRGVTLRHVLKQLAEGDAATVEKYPLPALLTAFQKVCDAVAFAHSKGVIHRDLKPENIMVGDFGEVLVMDWGLAKILEKRQTPNAKLQTPNAAAGSSIHLPPEHSGSMTMAGSVLGTPQYMSPEQACSGASPISPLVTGRPTH